MSYIRMPYEYRAVTLREVQRRARREILEFLGGRCTRCDFSDSRALQVDHVNGDGAEKRRAGIRGGKKLLADIKQNPTQYQLLCANCNWIKRVENGEQPKTIY